MSELKPSRGILKRLESPHHARKEENVLKTHASGGVKSVKFKRSKSVQQARLRAKLNAWLEAKGKTPSRYYNLMHFDEQLSAKKKREQSLPGTLLEDLVGKQLLEKEDLNARKKLFKDDIGGTNEPDREFASSRRHSSGKHTHVVKKENTLRRKSTVGHLSPHNKDKRPFSDKSNQSSTLTLLSTTISQRDGYQNYPSNDDLDSLSPQSAEKRIGQESEITDHDIRENLLSMLQECLTLYRAGCPMDHILSWLENMEQHIPQTQTCALFYACKAELCNTDPVKMLEVFCQGVENRAEPSQVLSDAMRNLLGPHISHSGVIPATQSLSAHFSQQNESCSGVEYNSCEEVPEDDSTDDEEDILPHRSLTFDTVPNTTSECYVESFKPKPDDGSSNLKEDELLPDCHRVDGVQNTSRRFMEESKSKTPVKNVYTSSVLSSEVGSQASSGWRKFVKDTPYKDSPLLGSTVKYTVAAVNTPIPAQSPEFVPKTAVVTPVRRSTRLSSRYSTPQAQREIDSVLDLTLKEAETTMFCSNPAMENNN